MLGSETFKNILFEGQSVPHPDSGFPTTAPGGEFGTYHETAPVSIGDGLDAGTGIEALEGILYQGFAWGAVIFSLWSLIELGKSAILAILLMLISVVARIVLNYRCQTTFFVLWFHPFSLLGWRLLVNSMWAHSNHNFLEPFGIFFLTLAFGASYFLDCSESKGMFMYAWLSFFIMFFGRAYGSTIPFIICGILLVFAVMGTVIYSKMDPKDRHCRL